LASIYLYAVAVKNMRGVLYSRSSASELREKARWLARRFRYRSIGVTKWLLREYSDVAELRRRPFKAIKPPTAEAKRVLEAAGRLGPAVEHAVAASLYVSPLIIAGEEGLGELKPYVVAEVKCSRELSDREWRLHFRIADYAVLDMAEWAIESTRRAVEGIRSGGGLSEVVEERKARVQRDLRRYWRISEEEGRTVVAYIDLLAACRKLPLDLEWATPALSVVAAVIV